MRLYTEDQLIRILSHIEDELNEMDGLLVKSEPRLFKLKCNIEKALNDLGEI
jgi:hypothetical protein